MRGISVRAPLPSSYQTSPPSRASTCPASGSKTGSRPGPRTASMPESRSSTTTSHSAAVTYRQPEAVAVGADDRALSRQRGTEGTATARIRLSQPRRDPHPLARGSGPGHGSSTRTPAWQRSRRHAVNRSELVEGDAEDVRRRERRGWTPVESLEGPRPDAPVSRTPNLLEPGTQSPGPGKTSDGDYAGSVSRETPDELSSELYVTSCNIWSYCAFYADARPRRTTSCTIDCRSDGLTPGILDACPSDSGRTRSSFWRASVLRLASSR